jgi:hypothetical protein
MQTFLFFVLKGWNGFRRKSLIWGKPSPFFVLNWQKEFKENEISVGMNSGENY